jgi:hypothetical protein
MAGPAATSCRLIVGSASPLAGIEACRDCPADAPRRMLVRHFYAPIVGGQLDWRRGWHACEDHPAGWRIQVLDMV